MNRTPLSTAVPDCNPSLSVFSQRIFNLPLPLFAIALLVMAAAIATDTLPSGMIGALLVMMLLGELLGLPATACRSSRPTWAARDPGAVRCRGHGLFRLAAQGGGDDVASFMKGGGFLDFYIAALITGSILGMDAKVLVKVGSRYAPPLLCSVRSRRCSPWPWARCSVSPQDGGGHRHADHGRRYGCRCGTDEPDLRAAARTAGQLLHLDPGAGPGLAMSSRSSSPECSTAWAIATRH